MFDEDNARQFAILIKDLMDKGMATEQERDRIIITSFFQALGNMERLAGVMMGNVTVRVEELSIYTPEGVRKVKRP